MLTVDDQFEIARVGSPKVSPDGEWIAYTVSTTSLEEEKSETRIWMTPAAGGDAIPMTAAGSSAGSPEWSPDGRYLSFTASRDGSLSQVWLLDRRGGEAQQLTEVEQGVGGYSWSPDSSKLLLTIRDPEPEGQKGMGEGARADTQKPWVIDRLQFKRDNVGYLTGNRHTHLYVFDVAAKQLTQITSGAHDESQPAWSPDGALVAFASNRTAEPDGNSNTDIWIVDADNTDRGATMIQVTTNPGADRSPAWSPDGNWITYTTVTQPELIWYATGHLAMIPVEGGEARLPVRSLDRNAIAPRFSDDGKSIWFMLEDSGERHLAAMDVASGRLERPLGGTHSVRGFDMGPDGMVAALVSTTHMPAEIFVVGGPEVAALAADSPVASGLDNGGQEGHGVVSGAVTWRQASRVNDSLLAHIELGEVETVQFPSKDGTEIEAFITKPPGFDPAFRYPTLLRIHGGPVSQFDVAFNFEAQLFAAHGYVVVQTNPRGSSGYGQDFSAALWANWGVPDFDDVMAAVDYAIDQGYADPDRLGVGGWSYGGILTDHVITKTDRFKGAISGASEVLYVANYGHDHYQLQWESELGLPWDPEARKVWERLSPFNRVDNVTTPTLVMGGEVDWNVPIQNSEQLYQALRRLGVPTQLVVYPGQSHGLRVPSYQKDRYERYLAWYDKWVKGEVRTANDE